MLKGKMAYKKFREELDDRIIQQIPNLNAITPWLSKITPKIRHQCEPVLEDKFIPHFISLRLSQHVL